MKRRRGSRLERRTREMEGGEWGGRKNEKRERGRDEQIKKTSNKHG